MSENSRSNICPKCHAPVPHDAPQGLCPRCALAGVAEPADVPFAATSTAEIPSLERIAAAFPQLEVIELIGRGGMGFVFKARQPHLDRFVALKLLPDKMARDPHFAERFNREGRVLAKLNHPNIVGVFDFGQTGGFYYLLMEYVDGVNLRQAMRAGRFSPTEALGIVPRVCEALQYAHDQGVLHRDIKPENILLDAKGRVKIADFGIAKLVGEDAPSITLTGTGAALGTPHYMAPEQLEKPNLVDHRADIYSLGVVFYEMLTGELPIGRFAPPSARTPMDDRVDRIVLRALEKERELRQQNAGEFKTEVEQVAANPSDARANKRTGTAALSASAFRWWHHVARGAIAGAVILLLVVLGAVAVTPFLPRTYQSTARLAFTKQTGASDPQWVLGTGPDGIRSAAVLSNAAAELTLRKQWSRKHKASLSDAGVQQLMRAGLNVRKSRLSALYDVTFVSDDAQEAANVANAVASAFRASHEHVQIVDMAEVPTRAVRPRPLFNAAVSAFVGALLGFVGAVVFAVRSWRAAREDANAPAAFGPHGTLVVNAGSTERPSVERSFAPWQIVPRWAFLALLAFGLALGVLAWRRAPESFTPHQSNEPLQLARGTVELVSISAFPSDSAPWRPDGRPSTETLFDPVPGAAQPEAGEQTVQFFFRVDPSVPGSSSPQFIIDSAKGWKGTSQPTRRGQEIAGGFLVAARFPQELKRTTIRAGMATDPWEIVAQNSANTQREATQVFRGQRLKIQFLAAVEDRQTNTVVNVLHNIRDLDYRLVAIDTDGREIPSLLSDSTRNHLSATFVNLPLGRIREFQFQARPYRWVEFKRVALQPEPAPVETAEPIRLRFRLSKGQVATFQVVRTDVQPPVPVEHLAGYVIAPSDERARGEILLVPEQNRAGRKAWRLQLESEEGLKMLGSSAELGELLSSIQPAPNNFWEVRPNSDLGIMLTHRHPLGADTNSRSVYPELQLFVTSTAYSNTVSGILESPVAGTGTTNWAGSLPRLASKLGLGRAYQWHRSSQVETSSWVRFLFTAVEVRKDSDGHWLGFDYTAQEHDAAARPFRWEQNISGFAGKTRIAELADERGQGSPVLRRFRAEFLMPAFLTAEDLQAFRDSLAEGTVGESIIAHGREQKPVFKFPVGERGTLGAWVGAEPDTSDHD